MEQTLDPTLDPAKLRALELLRRAKRFLIVGHVRPDGDCLGSQTALARVLTSLGKSVAILNPDAPEARYDYLADGALHGVFAGGELPEHDVAVLVDFCELSRTGPLAAPLAAAPSKKLVIDHHLHHGEAWWDEAFVDPAAPATGILVHRIAEILGVEIDPSMARAILTSLVTDTGWFKYSNTDAEAFTVASAMVRAGVEPAALYGAIYQRRGPGHPRYVARLLASLEYHAGGRLAVVSETKADRAADPGADADDVLDFLRSVEAVEVVLHLRELEDGTCKLSARSKSDYDVNQLARRFGGGGHRKASGATLAMPLERARAALIEAAVRGFDGVEAAVRGFDGVEAAVRGFDGPDRPRGDGPR